MKLTKRLLCLLLTSIMVLSVPFGASAKEQNELPFTDVPAECFYREPLEYLYYNTNVVKGKTETTFAPDDPITRAEFITLMYRVFCNYLSFSDIKDTQYQPHFFDVPEDKFYSIPITWAVNAGIVHGYENGRFGAMDKITREQMATIFYRADQYYASRHQDYKSVSITGTEINAFADGAAVSSFAREGMNFSIANKIISGREYSDGTKKLSPQARASRAETVTMIYRFY